jgi:hypothetical protein
LIQLRGPTPREKKLLERIKLLEEHIAAVQMFEVTRKKQADDVERNRAEIMNAMIKQIDTQRHEISDLREKTKMAIAMKHAEEDRSFASQNTPGDRIEAASIATSPLAEFCDDTASPAVIEVATSTENDADTHDHRAATLTVRSTAETSTMAFPMLVESLAQTDEDFASSRRVVDLELAIQTLEGQLVNERDNRKDREERFRSAVAAVQSLKQRANDSAAANDALERQMREVGQSAQRAQDEVAHANHRIEALSVSAIGIEEKYRIACLDAQEWSSVLELEVLRLLRSQALWISRASHCHNDAEPQKDIVWMTASLDRLLQLPSTHFANCNEVFSPVPDDHNSQTFDVPLQVEPPAAQVLSVDDFFAALPTYRSDGGGGVGGGGAQRGPSIVEFDPFA